MFMKSVAGEIQFRTMSSTAGNMNARVGSEKVLLGGELALLSPQVGEFICHDQIGGWPSPPSSSSSSSLYRSLSIGSPEYSSLILSNATSAAVSPRVAGVGLMRETSVEQVVIASQLKTSPPHQQLLVPTAGHHHVVPMQDFGRFDVLRTDDVEAAMASAMMAVITSSEQPCGQASRPCGAFGPYSGASPIAANPVSPGQGMMKRAFSIMREIRSPAPESTGRQLSNSQTNHVISERKRREKLNESFDALRGALPPGTKRDKASVLASTIDFVNSLKAEISELEGKNRVMEARLQLPSRPDGTSCDEELPAADDHDGVDDDDVSGKDPGNKVRVEIDRIPHAASSSGSGGLQHQQVRLRVVARVEVCDMIDLVLHLLERLKTVRGVKLVSLDAGVLHARQMNPVRRATLTMQIKGDEWDEDSFKRSIAMAVKEVAASPSRRPETALP